MLHPCDPFFILIYEGSELELEIKLPGFRSEPSEPVHDLDPTHGLGHGRVRVGEVHKLYGSRFRGMVYTVTQCEPV